MTRAFTLIELLVVITIIVVLLALLAPALDKAIYEAELAVCGANQRAGGSALVVYAMDHKRRYPHRPSFWMPPFEFYDAENSPDLRPLLRDYMDINAVFNDPLNTKVDFAGSRPSTRVYSDYNMWFGYRYQLNGELTRSTITETTGGQHIYEQGMLKMGDRLGYRTDLFDFLISDLARLNTANNLSVAGHPDHDGVMASQAFQDQRAPHGLVITLSWWDSLNARGDGDFNFLRQDGAVERHNEVSRVDPRMAQLTQDGDGRNPTLVVNLPLRSQP